MKHVLIILLATMTVTSRAQSNTGGKTQSDPFIGFLKKTENLQHFSYCVIQRQKSLFSEDTTVKEAEVTISKVHDSITYFHIRGKGPGEELVFRQDTGWYLPAGGKEWKVAGTGIENVKNSSLFHFIPVSLFTIEFRSEIPEPFWSVKSRAGGIAVVEIDIREKQART